MRKTAAIVLAGMMLAAIAGCGGAPKSVPQAAETAAAAETKVPESAAAEAAAETKTQAEVKAPESLAQAPTETEAAPESPAETEAPESTAAEFIRDNAAIQSFFRGESSLEVAGGFDMDCRMIEAQYTEGESFMLPDLLTKLSAGWPLEDAGEPEIQIADLEIPGRNAWAVSLMYDTPMEPFTQFYICSEENDGLKLHYAIDGWSRRYPSITKFGVIFDGGSDGAADHTVSTWVPREGMYYVKLSQTREIGSGAHFYHPDWSEAEEANEAIDAIWSDPEVDEGNIYMGQSYIGDKAYYYFGGYGGITQAAVDHIDGIAAEHGFRFDGITAVREAEKERAESLGAGDVFDKDEPADWYDPV